MTEKGFGRQPAHERFTLAGAQEVNFAKEVHRLLERPFKAVHRGGKNLLTLAISRISNDDEGVTYIP